MLGKGVGSILGMGVRPSLGVGGDMHDEHHEGTVGIPVLEAGSKL